MQITLFITAIAASILSSGAIFLAYRAAYIRKMESMPPGTEGNINFIVANRAHANLLENTPIFLILLFIAEVNMKTNSFLAIVAIFFVMARICHAFGYIKAKGGSSGFRTIGNIVTWLSILSLCIYNVSVLYW